MDVYPDGWKEVTPLEPRDVLTFPSGASLPVVSGPVADHEEHWDPKQTGNPLVDAAAIDTRLASHFTVGELARSGGTRFPVARIDPELVRCLQGIRDLTESPVVITSGYRSWGYNARLYERRGQTPTLSRHCCGQAADVKVPGMRGIDIAKSAIEAYGRNVGVGIGSDNAHIDVRGKWARWTYLDGDEHQKAIEEIDAFRASRRGMTPLVGRRDASTPAEIDVGHAVARNQHHADELGWDAHRSEIEDLIGLGNAPSEEDFARAVGDWQAEQGLVVDGILGPNTWARITDVRGAGDNEGS